MKAFTKAIRLGKTVVTSAALVLTMVQCSEEQIVQPKIAADEQATYAASEAANIASISVSGLYTEIVDNVQCGICSYVVAENESLIDGKALGLRAGSVICLNKSVKYPALEFVNMEGAANSPITIGYCSE
jgi:hypothetical protein